MFFWEVFLNLMSQDPQKKELKKEVGKLVVALKARNSVKFTGDSLNLSGL